MKYTHLKTEMFAVCMGFIFTLYPSIYSKKFLTFKRSTKFAIVMPIFFSVYYISSFFGKEKIREYNSKMFEKYGKNFIESDFLEKIKKF